MRTMMVGLWIATVLSVLFLHLNWAEESKDQKAVDIWDVGQVDAKNVKLEIAFLIDRETTSLRYILSNNSKVLLQVSPINHNENITLTQAPNGKVSTLSVIAEPTPPPAIIPSRTSKYWDVNIVEALQYAPYTDHTGKLIPGEYRLSWKMKRYDPDHLSHPDPFVSNEIILTVLEEEDRK